jgi:folate-dependent phosphoribosylglycinamide formyltransferase PurN
MKVLILTTDAPHHSFFVRELAVVFPQLHVIIESTGLSPLFDVRHSFEQERDFYELRAWFNGAQVTTRELAETFVCENINQAECIAHISELRPEVTVVFGTRKLSPSVIEAAGANIVNLHGGDPEYYRGLDSHLWAIYHGDYSNLVTTLHTVNEVLDDGRIIGISPIPLVRGMKLHELRRRNTECALRLTVDAIGDLVRSGIMQSRAQRQSGRYYSFMPSVLKALCVKKFERYCANLK